MPLPVLREADIDASYRLPLSAAVIGYGNQGRAHALNLRDSGFGVIIGQRPGPSFDRAAADGFQPRPVRDAAATAELLIITLPDESASETYETDVRPALRPGVTLGFVHGFNIRFGFIRPPADVDVVMIAPKGPGALLRSLYVDGKGLPSLLAVHQDATGAARRTALRWAWGIGALRAGVIETTFAAETETDLFGEQVVLCGGVSALTKAAFETLVDAGYDAELAYIECVHELKQVVDLLYERGLAGMRDRISNTAEYGDLTRGPRLVTQQTREEMRRILQEVRSGAFAKEWIDEHRRGQPRFRQLYEADANSLYEKTGQWVRGLMPWLGGSGREDRDGT